MNRIDRILARSIELPLVDPFETAYRRAAISPTVLVELKAQHLIGYGEATPVRQVTGEDVSSVVRDIAVAAEVLEGTDLSEYRLSIRKLAEALPKAKSARAGIEMAILDAYCKTLGIPLYSLLGGSPVSIETDVTISMCPPERAREIAREMSAKGFRLFKIKVGKDWTDDTARVVAVSESVPGCSLILDANQGYMPDEAVKFAKSILGRGCNIALIEQPVDALDLDGLAYVTEHLDVPVFADESAQTPADALAVVRRGAANGINVKIMKAGMLGALDIQSICRTAGLDLMFGCMLESRIGQSAAVHIACGTHAFSVFDLDSDLLLAEGQPVKGGAQRHGPMLEVSSGPGLGCEIIESALEPFIETD